MQSHAFRGNNQQSKLGSRIKVVEKTKSTALLPVVALTKKSSVEKP